MQCQCHHTVLRGGCTRWCAVIARINSDRWPSSSCDGDPKLIPGIQGGQEGLKLHDVLRRDLRLVAQNPQHTGAELLGRLTTRSTARKADAEVKSGMIGLGLEMQLRTAKELKFFRQMEAIEGCDIGALVQRGPIRRASTGAEMSSDGWDGAPRIVHDPFHAHPRTIVLENTVIGIGAGETRTVQ